MKDVVHRVLPSGLEYGVHWLPARHLVSFQLRFLVGVADEPPELLGLAHLVEETLDKGTEKYGGRELADAFDAIGAGRQSGTGRETMTFTCSVLPEHFERAVELHAELMRRPTFPSDAVAVNVQLAKQELIALDDDAQALMDKIISRYAYGPSLGRHALGEPETLSRVERSHVQSFWRTYFHSGRMLAAVAGAVEPQRAADVLARHFDGFGDARGAGRDPFSVQFSARTAHHEKNLEQQQMAICWPGVDVVHEDFPIQQVTLGILSGGMSARLFTEVREKRGLVYWVGAWQETPRGAGMMFLGASTTPERCDQTFTTLLGEVDRLTQDLTTEELERAITGIVANQETRGDTTRARCTELASDLFFHGHPVPVEEKLAKIRAVRIADIRRYLEVHPRDRLCVATLGPRPLTLTCGTRASGALTEAAR
jgi:predicted Zn-dependent peptidase